MGDETAGSQTARDMLIAARDQVRQVVGGSCGETVGDMAADAIDYHTDCHPWGWEGMTVVCVACDEIILPDPNTLLDEGALAWSR